MLILTIDDISENWPEHTPVHDCSRNCQQNSRKLYHKIAQNSSYETREIFNKLLRASGISSNLTLCGKIKVTTWNPR